MLSTFFCYYKNNNESERATKSYFFPMVYCEVFFSLHLTTISGLSLNLTLPIQKICTQICSSRELEIKKGG